MISRTQLLRELVSEALAGQSVLVTGSSGWFGKALLPLVDQRRITVLYLQSRTQVVVHRHGKLADIIRPSDFRASADVIVDLAFETRDKHGSDSDVLAAIEGNNSLLGHVSDYLTKRRFGRYLGISSGAALANNPDDHYGFAKARLEEIFLEKRADVDKIARVWSVSGAFCIKPELFAFSDFMLQAMRGDSIEVRATSPTYRRYCAVEEVLALLISGNCPPLFDSGGALVEMGDLAVAVAKVLKPGASIERKLDPATPASNYYSSHQTFETCMESLGLIPMTLEEQIKNALRGLDPKVH